MKYLSDKLQQLEQQGLKRQLRIVDGAQGRQIKIDGKQVLNFCSNDYLGLASDQRLRQEMIDAVVQYGVGAGASRLVSGNMSMHSRLESDLAMLKKCEASLVFSTGYMANVGIIPALFDRHDIIFADKLNHACLVDGAILSRAIIKRYPHNDMEWLDRELAKAGRYKRRVIITDSIFSMDGDWAPLSTIVQLAQKYDAMVMIDEAHSFGVFGENGGGLAEALELKDEIDIQMGTLSKAAGCFGGYVCGSQLMKEYLINHARSFIYTTGMPPAICAAARESLEIIQQTSEKRKDLLRRAHSVCKELNELGYDTGNSKSLIIPVIVKDADKAVAMSQKLLEKGFFVQAIRPPTVPKDTARLRLTITMNHYQQDLDDLIQVFKDLKNEV